jgi:hypothetical protein
MKQQQTVPEPSEPTIDDLLSDPIVRAVMAADDVDPDKLRDLLRSVAERLQARGRDGIAPAS